MTAKWDSELTEEKLAEQIKLAKEKYQEIHWKISDVKYRKNPARFLIRVKDLYSKSERSYTFPVYCFKCLDEKTEEEISKVTLLGERAIQWKDLDIEIGLEKLLMSVQLLDEWEQSLQ